MEWFESVKQSIPPELYAPVAFCVWVAFLWAVKGIVVARLKKWAKQTTVRWDDVLIDAIAFPANFLILASGLTIFTRVLSLPPEIDKFILIALKGSIIFAVVSFLDRLAVGIIREYSSKAIFSGISQGVTKGILRALIIGVGALIFLDSIGISITPILASLGIGSLAVALALQDTLSNLFAGLYVAVDRPVQVGNFIRLETGEEGLVTDVGWRSTRIQTLPGNIVIIPNSKLMSSVITNYHLPTKDLAVLVQVGVHYDSDLKKVETVTVEVAREIMKKVPGGVPSFEPMVRFHTFDDSSINFTAVLRAREFPDSHIVKHEFIKALHERFRRENIVIPYPIRTLEIAKAAVFSVKNQS